MIYAMFALATITTLLLTLLPPRAIPESSLMGYDKLAHFLLFFGWTFLLGLSWLVKRQKAVPLFTIFLCGAVFGLFIEFAQGWMPYGRSPDMMDAVADAVGSLSAVTVLWMLQYQYLTQAGMRKTDQKNKK